MNDPRQLIDAFLDDQLDDRQAAELQRWLAAERGNLREFMRATAVHRGLRREFLNAAARSGFAAATDITTERPTRASSRRQSLRRRRSVPWWPRLGLAAAACLLIGLGALLLAPGRDAGGDVDVTAGTVTATRGGPAVVLRPGDRARVADVLRSGDGPATLRFADGTTVTLAAGAELTLVTAGDGTTGKRLRLTQGRLRADVAKQPPGRPLVIATATATATVIGTIFSLSSAVDEARLDVDHGRVRLERVADWASVEVGAGEYAVATPGTALVVRKQGSFPGDQPLRVGGVRGNQLVGADSKRFVMKGAQLNLNLFYQQIGSPYEAALLSDRTMYERAFTDRLAQLDAMKACGINTVRIHVGATVALDPNNGYRTRAEGYGGLTGYIQRLATYADDARSRGFHIVFCYYGDDAWSSDVSWPRYRQLFAALVPALKDNGNVLYELVNNPDLADGDWTRLSKRSIDLFRSLGYAGPLIVGLNHMNNWWYEPEVEQVARHDPQLVFSLHFARWVGWSRTAGFFSRGADHALILGEFARVVNGDVGEAEALAAAAAMRELVERGQAVGAIANGWNIRDAKPPVPGNGLTDDDAALLPNTWGAGYRDQFSGRLPDWLPILTTP